MKAQVNLEQNNFSIIFNQSPPVKIIFQLEYFNFKKSKIEDKVKFWSENTLIDIEKIINFLGKNKIQCIHNND